MDSSFSDWESVRDDDDDGDGDTPAGKASPDRSQVVVLELPPGGFVGGDAGAAATAPSDDDDDNGDEDTADRGSSVSSFVPVSRFDGLDLHSRGSGSADAVAAVAANAAGRDRADASSDSSFVPVPRFANMSVQGPPSAASSYRYSESSDRSNDVSLSSNFDVLSLSSGEVVRRCGRCRFHNGRDSVVCASCELALVANPCVDVDAQIAMHLQQKEESDARALLLESERESELRRNLVARDPLYVPAQVLTCDIKEACSSFKTLPIEDMEGQVLRFIKQVTDLPLTVQITFAFKCTSRESLPSVRTDGLPRYKVLSAATNEVEVSHSLEAARLSFETMEMMSAERTLRPISEDGNEDEVSNDKNCLCWIVAILQSWDGDDAPSDGSDRNALLPHDRTLPVAYFDSSDDVEAADISLDRLREAFTVFFQENLDLPIPVTEPPKKKAKRLEDDSKLRGNDETAKLLGKLDESSVGSSSASADNSSESSLVQDLERQLKGQMKVKATPEKNADTFFWGDLDEATKSPSDGEDSLACRPPNEKVDEQPSESTSLEMKGRIQAIVPFGRNSVAVCCNDHDVFLCNQTSGMYTKVDIADIRVSCLASATAPEGDAELLAIGGMCGAVIVYTLRPIEGEGTYDATASIELCNPGAKAKHRNVEMSYNFTINQVPIMDLRFLPKRTAIAATNKLRECQLWSLKDGSRMCSLRGENLKQENLDVDCGFPTTGCFSHDGNSLASVAEGSPFVHFLRLQEGAQQLAGHEPSLDVLGRQEYRIRAVSFSADGKYLASAANDCTVRLWDVCRRHRDLFCHPFHKDDVPCVKVIRVPVALSCLTFSPDSKLVAGGCANGSVQVWDVRGRSLWTFSGHRGTVMALAFLNDSNTLVSASWSDSSLRFWSLRR